MEVVIGKTEVLLLLVIVGGTEIGLAKYFPWLALYLDLPLVLVIYIGWYSRPAKAAICGSAFGLLADAFLRILLGLNGVSKTTIGFVTAYVNRWVMIGGFLPAIVCDRPPLTLLDNFIVFCMLELLSQLSEGGLWVPCADSRGRNWLGGRGYFPSLRLAEAATKRVSGLNPTGQLFLQPRPSATDLLESQ